jgi:hypothetical protein
VDETDQILQFLRGHTEYCAGLFQFELDWLHPPAGLCPISFTAKSHFTPKSTASGGFRRLKIQAMFFKPCEPDFMDIAFELCVEGLSAHQNTERIVERDRAGRKVERRQAVARVSEGFGALDSRCVEDWESLHARPCQTRRAVPFRGPCFRPS